jgi:hemoglobin-like flavoprotein
MREIFEDLMRSLERLRDPAFIKVRYSVLDRGPQCVVMEYVDWPTLADTLAQHPGRRLPPTVVAKLLATIARAQGDAHRCGVQVGPLSSANIHASETWDLRISPLRLKGQLARAAGLTTGQLVNWELLTTLTPELWDGRQPATLAELDRHEQYYLGMFGLQLLLGRSPFAVHRFDDLLVKARFFENPRAFFDDEASGAARWTDDCPGLAFVLTRLLARDPAARFQSVDDVIEELEDVERGKLPHSARRRLELDLRERMGPEFIASFYDRLFALRPELRTLFRTPHTQPKMLADALQDLAAHRPHSEYSRFLDKAKQHAAYGITADDVDAFRTAFLEHVAERCPPQSGSRDAWAAALGIGLALMKTHLVARTRDASAS